MVNMLISRVIDRGFVHDCSDKFFKITGFDEFFCCLINIFVPSNTFKVSFYFINVLLKVHQIGYYVFYGSGIGSLLLLEEGHLCPTNTLFSFQLPDPNCHASFCYYLASIICIPPHFNLIICVTNVAIRTKLYRKDFQKVCF